MFTFKNLNLSYKRTQALKKISLHISQGEKVALIGPSGAGKTTLLQQMYRSKKRESAFIHQDYALVPQLSAFHNVYMGRLDKHGTLYNLLNLIKPQANEIQKIRDILDSLGMEEKIFHLTGELSGGQQQRTAIGRALFRKSPILLGDEPVASIDPHQAGKILSLLLESAETVVLSLHSVQLALEFAQRMIGLRAGELIFDLPAKKVTDSLLAELYQPC